MSDKVLISRDHIIGLLALVEQLQKAQHANLITSVADACDPSTPLFPPTPQQEVLDVNAGGTAPQSDRPSPKQS